MENNEFQNNETTLNSNSFYASVFKWLALGLLITFGAGYLLYYQFTDILVKLLSGGAYFVILIAELILVIAFRVSISKMNFTTSLLCYALYSLLTGFTMAVLFAVFEGGSIISIFLVTAVVFGIFGLIGSRLKMPLNRFGTFLIVGLLAIVILEIVNIFLLNNTLEMVLCIAGLVIFIGFIMFDFNRIQVFIDQGTGYDKTLALHFAFELYLDFINTFIKLLRLFGKRKD